MNSDLLFHILLIIFSAYVTLGESVCDIENTVPSLYREAILEVCRLYNYSDQDCIEGEGVQIQAMCTVDGATKYISTKDTLIQFTVSKPPYTQR